MVAMLAFGGTYAYFTATAEGAKSGDILTAKLNLTNKTTTLTANANTDIVPGAYIFGGESAYQTIDLGGTSTAATYVFVEFSVDAQTEDGTSITLSDTDKTPILEYDVDSTLSWVKIESITDKDVYYLALAKDTEVSDFKFNVKFSEKVQANNDQTAGETHNTTANVMAASIVVNANFAAIQQLGYTVGTITDAYEDAFAAVVTDDFDAVRGN